MIVGDSRTGAIGPSTPSTRRLRLYLDRASCALVPAAAATCGSTSSRSTTSPTRSSRLTFDPRAAGLTFHLTAPASPCRPRPSCSAPTAPGPREHLGVRLAAGRCVPLPAARPWPAAAGEPAALGTLLPYADAPRASGATTSTDCSAPDEPDWRAYPAAPARVRDGRRVPAPLASGRFTSRSFSGWRARHRPVDLPRPGREPVRSPRAGAVRGDMLAAPAPCGARGRPGDRVAVVGLNSTRYLTRRRRHRPGRRGRACRSTHQPAGRDRRDPRGQRSAPAARRRAGRLAPAGGAARPHSRSSPSAARRRRRPARPVLAWDDFLALRGDAEPRRRRPRRSASATWPRSATRRARPGGRRASSSPTGSCAGWPRPWPALLPWKAGRGRPATSRSCP